MALPDPTKRKASFARKSKPEADAPAAEAARPSAHTGVQFGPTKSAPGSRLKGGK